MKKYKYRNITVSGLPGAGSTTLGKSLEEELGWKYFSGGDFLRAWAAKRGLFDANNKLHHDQSIMGDEADLEVDFLMRSTVESKENNILDSWLSGFMAQGVEEVLSVLVVCSENQVRVDRVVNRDEVSIEEAKKHIFDRERKNVEKWVRMYGKYWQEWVVGVGTRPKGAKIDFWHPSLYDLVIDTYSNSKEQTLGLVLKELRGE